MSYRASNGYVILSLTWISLEKQFHSKIFWEAKNMKQNVHNIERVVRIVVGLVLLCLVFVGPQTAWGWIGLLPLVTGIVGWCPPYALLKINTREKKATSAS
jgi:hypothetical protein